MLFCTGKHCNKKHHFNFRKLTWSASQGAIKYTVQFKPLNAATFTNKSTATTAINLTGLLSNTQYAWKVKAVCSLKSSAFTALNNFTTPPALTGGSSSGAEIQQQTDLSFYPNPATNFINVNLNETTTGTWQLSVANVRGQVMLESSFTGAAKQVDVSRLVAGTYTLSLFNSNGDTHSFKFIKL